MQTEVYYMATKKVPPRHAAALAAKPNYRWFKAALADRRMSQRELARRLKMDAGGLNRRLKGKARLQLADAAEIAKLLEVPISEVLTNAGVPLPDPAHKESGTVPITGWVDQEFSVHEGRPKGPKTVEAPPVPIEGLEALRFITAASRADAFDGAVAYFRPAADIHADAIGRLCVITTATGAKTLRVLRQGYVRGKYNLAHPVDGQVEENVSVDSAAPVVWLKM